MFDLSNCDTRAAALPEGWQQYSFQCSAVALSACWDYLSTPDPSTCRAGKNHRRLGGRSSLEILLPLHLNYERKSPLQT